MDLGPILSLFFIAGVITLLVKKYNPHAVLLISGFLMLVAAFFLNHDLPKLKQPTGLPAFDFIQYITESLIDTNAGVGLVIMIISGFVAYMDKTGASDALVFLAMKPLGFFKKYPYFLASLVLPLGQFLFISIPSAAGLGLLLMASVYPIIVNLGVSRVSAVSLISATTAFGIGPASAIALSGAKVLEMDITSFFFLHQIPLVVPLCITLTITYFFVNRYYDKKENLVSAKEEIEHEKKEARHSAPLIYAVLPVLPLALLLVFSDFVNLFHPAIHLDTNAAMVAGLFISLIFELVRTRSLMAVFKSLDVFWGGMGDIFKSVVTLIVTADIFSKGLISLGFIDGLIDISRNAGLGATGIGIVMTIMIFLASVLMGSGNAAFFAFGPLIPKIAGQLGAKSVSMILPMTLAASMGRTVSPIAGVVVAVGAIAKVTPVQIVKRNLIPFIAALAVMLAYSVL
ncbi:MAG: C4-dicarboxylate transporter DcuC [Bacteroidota bacterium]